MSLLRNSVALVAALAGLTACGPGADTATSSEQLGSNGQLSLSQDALRGGARASFGEVGKMFGHTVFTWGVYDRSGAVIAAGASVPVAAFEDATPAAGTNIEGAQGVVLNFPRAVQQTTFLNHLEFDWEPAGHPPFYLKPHFDLHFYRQSEAQVATIDCSDTTYPAADEMAPGYMLPPPTVPSCVPMMGYHAVPYTDADPSYDFEKTMIWGYYGGDVTFVEPMITQATLTARQSFDMDIPLMANLGAQPGTRVPTHFTAHYLSVVDSYELVFTGFTAVP